MTGAQRSLTTLGVIGLVLVGLTVYAFVWLSPALNSIRVELDNDRASSALIQQQQSNLDQLRRDLQDITDKQKELEKNVWTFQAEDAFFTSLESLAKANRVTLDAPNIADVTPNGTILVRAVDLHFQGSLANVLAAVTAVQHATPLLAIQRVDLTSGPSSGTVDAHVAITSLWK